MSQSNTRKFLLKFAYLKDMEGVDPFNISVLDRGKETKQGKWEVYITAVINYKTTCMKNGQPETVSLTLR